MELTGQSLREDCFEKVYKDHYLKVYLSVFGNLRCCRGRQQREEAEDTTQEVFAGLLRELQHRPDLWRTLAEDASLLRRLLHKIVLSKIVDHKRKYHLGFKQPVEMTDYIEEAFSTGNPNGSNDAVPHLPESKALTPEDWSILREALRGSAGCMDALSPKQRIALLLKHGAGLSIKEVAAIVRESEKTVQHSILPLAYDKFETRLKRWLRVSGVDPEGVRKLLELFIESREPLKGACPSKGELMRYLKGEVAASSRAALVEHIAVCRLCWKVISGFAGSRL